MLSFIYIYLGFIFTSAPCYRLVLLAALQMVMALTVGMGLIPIPSVTLRADHGHELVESSGQRSQSWS